MEYEASTHIPRRVRSAHSSCADAVQHFRYHRGCIDVVHGMVRKFVEAEGSAASAYRTVSIPRIEPENWAGR